MPSSWVLDVLGGDGRGGVLLCLKLDSRVKTGLLGGVSLLLL